MEIYIIISNCSGMITFFRGDCHILLFEIQVEKPSHFYKTFKVRSTMVVRGRFAIPMQLLVFLSPILFQQ